MLLAITPRLSRHVLTFEKFGFWITRQGKHITITDGKMIITIPMVNPINAYRMAVIVNDEDLSIVEFMALL